MSEQPAVKVKKVRRSAEEWKTLLASYEASGLSQESFCARESLALSTFGRWRNKLADVPAEESGEEVFVDLSKLAGGEASGGWDIELSLGGGLSLRLRQTR